MEINKVSLANQMLDEVFKNFQDVVIINGFAYYALIKDIGFTLFGKNNEKSIVTRVKIMPGDTVTYLGNNYLITSDVANKTGNSYYKARMVRCPYRIQITNSFYKAGAYYNPSNAQEPYYRPGGHTVMAMEALNSGWTFGSVQYTMDNAVDTVGVGPYIRDAVIIEPMELKYYEGAELEARKSNWALAPLMFYEVVILVKDFLHGEKINSIVSEINHVAGGKIVKIEESLVPGLVQLTCRKDSAGPGYLTDANIGTTANPYLQGLDLNPIPKDVPFYPYADPDPKIYAYNYSTTFIPTLTMSNAKYVIPDIIHNNDEVVYKHKAGFLDGIVEVTLPIMNQNSTIFDMFFRDKDGKRVGVSQDKTSIPSYVRSLNVVDQDPVIPNEFFTKYGNVAYEYGLLPKTVTMNWGPSGVPQVGWEQYPTTYDATYSMGSMASVLLKSGNAQGIDLSKPYLYYGGVIGQDPDMYWFNFMKNPIPIPAEVTQLCLTLWDNFGKSSGWQEIRFPI